MCLGIPGRIVSLEADRPLAITEVAGVRRLVDVSLLAGEGVAPGDWVLIHVGFALARIDEGEAADTWERVKATGPTGPPDSSPAPPGTRR